MPTVVTIAATPTVVGLSMGEGGAAFIGEVGVALDGIPMEPGTLADALIDYPTLHVLADRELGAGTLLDLIAAENLVAVNVLLVTLRGKAAAEDAQ